MIGKLHIFWRDAGITVRIKPNTQVATDTFVRSFFEVEEKNDIVADGEFALQRCRWRGGLAARPWPAKKREVSVGLKVKEMLVILSAQSMTHRSQRRVRHFNWFYRMIAYSTARPKSCHGEEVGRVATSLRKLLLNGFQETPTQVCTNCCWKQWWHQYWVDRTMYSKIKAVGIVDPVYSLCLAQ